MTDNIEDAEIIEEIKDDTTGEKAPTINTDEVIKTQEQMYKAWKAKHTPLTATALPGRNEICPFCNSGKKFKNCECYKTHTKTYTNQYLSATHP